MKIYEKMLGVVFVCLSAIGLLSIIISLCFLYTNSLAYLGTALLLFGIVGFIIRKELSEDLCEGCLLG